MIKCKIYALVSPEASNEYRYIGQTTQSLNSRLTGHLYDARRRNNHIQCWIRSLAKKGLKPMIILIDDCAKWNISEKYYINKYQREGHRLTNLTNGGNAFCGLSGIYNPFYGKNHSEETKKRISTSRIGKYTGRNNPNYGNRMSENSKKSISKKNSKPVKCENDGMIFGSMSKAADYYNIPIQYISLNISKGKPIKGLQFRLLKGEN
jgi:group I intron endonuclease